MLSIHIHRSVHVLSSSIRKQASNGWTDGRACAFLPFLIECPIESTRPNDWIWLRNDLLWTGFSSDDAELPLGPFCEDICLKIICLANWSYVLFMMKKIPNFWSFFENWASYFEGLAVRFMIAYNSLKDQSIINLKNWVLHEAN